MTWLTYVISVLGAGCLALSLPKHWRDVFGQHLEMRIKWALRSAGWGLVAAALVVCISRWGAAMGILTWVGTLSLSALCLAPLLAYVRTGERIKTLQ